MKRVREGRMTSLSTIHRVLAAASFVWLCTLHQVGAAHAHTTTYAVYSKYEATARGRDIAFVFALDRDAVLGLLQRDMARRPVAVGELGQYRGQFSRYLFERFFVANGGVSCTHPQELALFGWDE